MAAGGGGWRGARLTAASRPLGGSQPSRSRRHRRRRRGRAPSPLPREGGRTPSCGLRSGGPRAGRGPLGAAGAGEGASSCPRPGLTQPWVGGPAWPLALPARPPGPGPRKGGRTHPSPPPAPPKRVTPSPLARTPPSFPLTPLPRANPEFGQRRAGGIRPPPSLPFSSRLRTSPLPQPRAWEPGRGLSRALGRATPGPGLCGFWEALPALTGRRSKRLLSSQA